MPAEKGAKGGSGTEEGQQGGRKDQGGEFEIKIGFQRQQVGPWRRGECGQRFRLVLSQIRSDLQWAWKLRDELIASDCRKHVQLFRTDLWSELELRLLRIDRQLRTGYVLKPNEVQQPLRHILDALEAIHLGKSNDALPHGSLASRIAGLRPGCVMDRLAPSSLALAQLVARERGAALPAELLPFVARYEQLVSNGDRSDLEKLAAELNTEHDRWRELRLVRHWPPGPSSIGG